jgi:hypothetical protein
MRKKKLIKLGRQIECGVPNSHRPEDGSTTHWRFVVIPRYEVYFTNERNQIVSYDLFLCGSDFPVYRTKNLQMPRYARSSLWRWWRRVRCGTTAQKDDEYYY